MKSGIANRFIASLMVSLFCMAGGNAAHAAGGNSTGGQWEYSLAPLFMWAQGIQGDSEICPTTSPLDISFKDALSNLEGTFTIHGEMKRDALTLFGEYQYVNLGPEAEGPMDIKLDVGFKDYSAELGVCYWVFGTERTDWEVLGGARYTKQKLDVSVKNGPDLVNVDEDWWVGFFGGRMSANLSKNLTFIARADFGVG